MKASESSSLSLFAAGLAYLIFSWSSALWQEPAHYRLASGGLDLSIPAGTYGFVQEGTPSAGGADFGATSEGPVAAQSNLLASQLDAIMAVRRLMPNAVNPPQEWQFHLGEPWRQKSDQWNDYVVPQPENQQVYHTAVATLDEEPSRLSKESVVAYYRPSMHAETGDSESDTSTTPISRDHPYTVADLGVGQSLIPLTAVHFSADSHDQSKSPNAPVPEPASIVALGVGSAYLLRKLRKHK